MVRNILTIMAVAVCVVGVSCSDDAVPSNPLKEGTGPLARGKVIDADEARQKDRPPPQRAAKDSPKDSQAIEGLWVGSWGGGARGEVVYQPAIGELFVKGEHIELDGFPGAGSLTGTVRLDASTKKIHITPTDKSGGKPAPKPIAYAYEIEGDKLTLTSGDKFRFTLQRRPVAQNPLANAQVELIAATGINAAGDLLVTEFTELRAGHAGATYFQPEHRSLKTKQATVLVVQETGCKKIDIDEARKLLRKSMPVAVTYRHNERPAPNQFFRLWKDMGPPAPDSDAVRQTFSRTLRPGTLVFILSASENVPVP